MHICAASGDHLGLEFLLGDLMAELGVCRSLYSPAQDGSGLPGHIPLHLVWTQEVSGLEDGACLAQSAATVVKYMGDCLGSHNSATCGEAPDSCVEHVPRFCCRVVRGLFHWYMVNFESDFDPQQDLDEALIELQCLGMRSLGALLRAWRAHLFLINDARMEVLLLPVFRAIVSSFGILSQVLEGRFERHCPTKKEDSGEKRCSYLIRLGECSRPLIELAIILMRVIDGGEIGSMMSLLLQRFPGLEKHAQDFMEHLQVA